MNNIILLSCSLLLFIGCDGDGTSSGEAGGVSGGLGGSDGSCYTLLTELQETGAAAEAEILNDELTEETYMSYLEAICTYIDEGCDTGGAMDDMAEACD
jgi:hypothetical protein